MEREEQYPKKVPIRWDDDTVPDKPTFAARDMRREQEQRYPAREILEEIIYKQARSDDRSGRERHSKKPTRREDEYLVKVIEEIGSQRARAGRSQHTDDLSIISDRDRDRHDHRRKEGIIHPRDRSERVVVAERFEYEPNQQSRRYRDEQERRVQERLDRDMLSARPLPRQSTKSGHLERGEKSVCNRTGYHHTTDDAHRYYHDDWHRPELSRERKSPQCGYRRDHHQDSDISESEDSMLSYSRKGKRNLQNQSQEDGR